MAKTTKGSVKPVSSLVQYQKRDTVKSITIQGDAIDLMDVSKNKNNDVFLTPLRDSTKENLLEIVGKNKDLLILSRFDGTKKTTLDPKRDKGKLDTIYIKNPENKKLGEVIEKNYNSETDETTLTIELFNDNSKIDSIIVDSNYATTEIKQNGDKKEVTIHIPSDDSKQNKLLFDENDFNLSLNDELSIKNKNTIYEQVDFEEDQESMEYSVLKNVEMYFDGSNLKIIGEYSNDDYNTINSAFNEFTFKNELADYKKTLLNNKVYTVAKSYNNNSGNIENEKDGLHVLNFEDLSTSNNKLRVDLSSINYADFSSLKQSNANVPFVKIVLDFIVTKDSNEFPPLNVK